MTLLFTIIILAFALQVLDSVGYARIAESIWRIFQRIFKQGSSKKTNKLKQKILVTQTELKRTSAQDEFAKWAKLRRSLDKMKAEYETISRQDGMSKTFFELKVSWGLRAILYGTQIWIVLMYRSTPVFYLPYEWLGPISFITSLPGAPAGEF
ncbi:WRB/Get1 family [Phlyctochytrium arcticum]|nr:WRB/Get1 family [Phlyctochytrium arcticum]